MSFLDVDRISAPISPDRPAGDDLEYDPAFLELDQAAKGREGVYNPVSKQIEGGIEPEWPRVRELAIALSGRTKDLRVAVHLCSAAVSMAGLPALAEAFAFMRRLLEQYWADVYPRLVEEEGNDPIDRVNALENLCDPAGLIRYLRRTTLVEARGVGRYSLRDLELAEGRLSPREKESVPTPALLKGAWAEGDSAQNEARKAAVDVILDHIKGIRSIFQEQSGTSPNLDELVRILRPVKEFYAQMSPAPVAEEEQIMPEHESESGALRPEGETPVASARTGGGGLHNRNDAIRQLRQVSDYLKQYEPSSPAPIFIDRAVKLLEMRFVDIVRELMPDARERIELIGGFKFDEQK